MSAPLAPPPLLRWAAEPFRAAAGVARLALAMPVLRDAPRGDGRPVMILPGLFNSDRSTIVMRRFLAGLGYDVAGMGLGRNLGARTIGPEGERLFARIAERNQAAGGPVTLIGVSLGGIMARLAAHRMPDAIREVVTIASPYAGDPRATNVWRLFEWISGERIDGAVVAARRAEVMRPLPVPATAIWSASDGIVNGRICRAPDEAGCRAIEIRSSHMGVQHDPAVLRLVAATLAGADVKRP